MSVEPTSVLVIEDAPEFVEMISTALGAEGYRVLSSQDGESGLELARTERPDVIILDLTLPGVDGLEVCRRLRTFTDAYIIMVTARGTEVDRLVGLAVGADDYLVKPFSVRELMARVQVVLRRPRTDREPEGDAADTSMRRELGDMIVDLGTHEVTVADQVVHLTKIEFQLLGTLTSRPSMVFTREMLIESVWGPHWVGDSHVVDVHIANMRKKIDLGDQSHIRTVRGVGYRFTPIPVEVQGGS